MASAKVEGGLSPQSPVPAEGGEKLNGEGDLDYTITMNESEDEASGDDVPAGKLAQKANRAPSPAKINGKLTSDEDSQSSVSKKVKADEANAGGEEKGENCALKDQPQDQAQDNDSENVKAQEGENDGQKSDRAEKEGSEEGKDGDEEKLDQNTTESDNVPDNHKRDDESSPAKPEDAKEKREENESQDSQKDLPGEERGESSKMETSDEQKEIEDDDVVEIEDLPMKQPVGKVLESSSGLRGANTPFVKGTSSSVSGANFVSYLSTVPGSTSLLTSTPGMQFVQVQGGLVYVPSSTGPSVSASGMAGINKGLSHSSASLLLPQYANMMTGQNRFMMPPYNQGTRPAVPSAPILTNIPDKPTSSIGMIENIRWEVENHINIKPKYAKPNPKAELGHLTKWMFDLGSDLVKEFVYHDLVRIQTYRNSEGTLSNKEKDDFAKLQEIDKELNQKIGHLKIRLNKHCKCGFRTELNNVLYNHQQHAHIERGGFFSCILCKFSTRQPSTFRFHMESIHGRPGFVDSRPSFFECPLCPYETNYQNRLDQHKVRCLRQFREAFNLHPSCVTGPEVNLCLENVFYYVFTRQFMNSIMPKQTASIVSSSTKIRDMPSNEVTRMNMQTKGIANAPSSTTVPSTKHIAPKAPSQTFQTGPATMKPQQPHLGTAVTRNYPVMSSKINMAPNQPGTSAYTPSRPQAPPQPQNQPPASTQPNNGFEVCEICGGYVKDRKALRIHFYYAHRIDMPFGVFERPQAPLYCATCFARFWTAQGLQKHIEVHKNDMMGTTQTSNGVAGKCISCGHRVPNILMHMRMVHNRELRHYLAALMCIFCGNRFSTKKEVEIHMGKMHGVLVKNSGGMDKPQMAAQGMPKTGQQPKPGTPAQKTASDAASSKGGSTKGKMNRSSQCVLCNLSFSRNVDLTRHCMRVHHTCMKCGLVVVDRESLARHTCLHSASGMRTCQICKESGFHPAYYIKHMRDKHLRKCSVVLRHIDRAVVETLKRPITISDSEDEEEEEDDAGEKPTKPKLQKRNPDEKVKTETTEEQTAADGDDKKPGETDKASSENDEAETGDSGKEKDQMKKEDAEKSGKEDEKHDTGDGDTVEQKDGQEKDGGSVTNEKADNENGENEERIKSEKSETVDSSDSKPAGTKDKQTEDSSAASDVEKQNDDVSVQKQQSDSVDKEEVTDKQGKDGTDRKKLKRKMDEVENNEEKDGPCRKSQRRSSQMKESQD